MGQGDFEIMYPPLHEIANSHNPWIRKLDDFITFLNPEPHRRTFMKAFMRAGLLGILRILPQGAPRRAGESLPLAPRLQRVRQLAGQRRLRPGRALVLLPAEVLHLLAIATCRWSPRSDPGNRNGKVHSHRFAAANTASPPSITTQSNCARPRSS